MESSKRDIIISVVACLIFVVVFVPSILVYGTNRDNETVVVNDKVSTVQSDKSDTQSPSSSSTQTLKTTSYILRSISSSSSPITSPDDADTDIEPLEALSGRSEVERRVDDILSLTPLIDGHNDLAYSVKMNLNNNVSRLQLEDLTSLQPWASQEDSNTDIRRLRQGRVGGQFWSAYIGCDSTEPVKEFLEQMDVIKQIVRKYPETFHYAESVADIRAGFRAGKISSLIGVESGHAINSSLGVLRSLYSLGARSVAGVDSLGLGSDFNGVGQYPAGLQDVSGYPNIFAALIRDKTFEWTDEDLRKLAGENILRVFREVEKQRRRQTF